MKIKHTLIILAIGLFLTFIGAVFKIVHFEVGPINGNSLLSTGMFVGLIGFLLFLYKLLMHPKFKDFLNY